MSQEQPLTYEGILELFRQTDRMFQETDRKFQDTDRKFQETREQMKETDRKFQDTDRKFQETREQMRETDRKFQETDRKFQETDRKISALGSRIGEIIENMVGGGHIVTQFQKLGYNVTAHSRYKIFGESGTSSSGEIDLFLEDGDIAILVEVKTTLKTQDVIDHIERLEKYRRYVDSNGSGEKRHFIGAVAGAVAEENVIKFAQSKGLYVIVQSGETFKIVTPPEGFKAKEY